MINPERISRSKRLAFTALMLLIPLLFLELLVRTYFAIQVGPHVFLYGTAFSRYQAAFDPKGEAQRAAKEDSTVAFHDDERNNYTKYYPNQVLIDRDEFGHRIYAKINSQGFRGKDYSIVKGAMTVRIITLGASSTFGFHDRDDETYPHYLETILNASLPHLNAQRSAFQRTPITSFEVINLGIPHLISGQIYSLLIAEGLKLEPDFVTFYEGINDTVWRPSSDTWSSKAKSTAKGIPFANALFRELRKRVLSVALFGSLISTQKISFSEGDFQLLSQERTAYFIEKLRLMHDACRQRGATFIVASQQATTLETDRERLRGMTYESERALVKEKVSTTRRLSPLEVSMLVHGDLMDAQRHWATSNGVPYVDAIKAMDMNRHNLVTWVHLNSKGNRIVAAALAEEILRQLVAHESHSVLKP
jgi:lysophospholipase L1-like esterase